MLTKLSATYPPTLTTVPNINNGFGPNLSNSEPPTAAREKTQKDWREPIQAVTELRPGKEGGEGERREEGCMSQRERDDRGEGRELTPDIVTNCYYDNTY